MIPDTCQNELIHDISGWFFVGMGRSEFKGAANTCRQKSTEGTRKKRGCLNSRLLNQASYKTWNPAKHSFSTLTGIE